MSSVVASPSLLFVSSAARRTRFARPFARLALGLLGPALASAQSGSTWTGAGGDNLWANPANWSAGVPASVDATADLGQIDLGADLTLTLADVTLNHLIVGDLVPGGGSWYLTDPLFSYSLTLAGVSPTITVGDLGAGALSLNSGAGALPLRASSGFTKDGPGRLELSANNALGDTILVKEGTLGGANASALNSAASVELAGGHLSFGSGTFTFSPAVHLAADATITFGNNSKTLTGPISGSDGKVLTINQSSGASSTISLAGNLGDFRGELVLGARYFRLDTAYATSFAASGAHTVWTINAGTTGAASGDGGLFYRNGTNATVTFALGALQGSGVLRGGGAAGTGTVVYEVGALGRDSRFTGLILDGATGSTAFTKTGLTKVGSGTLTLSGANAYTGATTVSAGALVVDGDQSAATGALTVAAGATLGGAGTLGSAATVHGILAPGDATTPAILTTKADLALSASATLRLRVRADAHDGLSLVNPDASGATTRSLSLGGKLRLEVAGDAPPGARTLVNLGANVLRSGDFASAELIVGPDALALQSSSGGVWSGELGGRAYVFDSTTGVLSIATATAPVAIEAWRQTHFGGPAATGDAADTADPDHDGLPNLLEYATGGDPLAANASPLIPALDSGRLTLRFPVRSDPNLLYTVEASDDLAVWTAIFNADGATLATGGATTRTVVDTVALSAHPRRFLRLVVTIAP